MSLTAWSYCFMVFYVALMLMIGYIASKRISHADDFATARGSYGPYVLALAFAASTASGATFLGTPALAYQWGTASNWSNFLYPIGVYFGILISMRLIASTGNKFGNRSIPEYLGDRYQSEGIRILVSLMSLVLFFYLAGQLVSGLVMFELMLGLSPGWALIITTVVLLVYVVMGGAHADIMTDAVQGGMMLILAIVVILLVALGFGIDGGFLGMIENLKGQDDVLVAPLNPKTPYYHSWWAIFAIVFAHIPLGLLPHLGNKLWALKDEGGQLKFVKLAFIFGLTLGMLGLAGLLARAHLGDTLLMEGANANQALPMLFIHLFPTWLAALIGVGVLAAIMSTADGLVVSSAQIIANDLYRRTIVPIVSSSLSEQELDKRILLISRVSTVAVLMISMWMAWLLLDRNVAMIVWIGVGGMMAAFAGPLVVGALWRGVTRKGAYAGLVAGFLSFGALHTKMINPDWFSQGTSLHVAATWLYGEGPNPISCAVIGEIVSIVFTLIVSKLTRPLSKEHLEEMFPSEA